MEEFSRFIDMNIVLRQKASCQSLTRRKLGINISIDALRIPYPHMPWVGALVLEGTGERACSRPQRNAWKWGVGEGRRGGCGPDSASTRPPWGPRQGSGPGPNLYLHWRPSPQRPRQADGRKLRLRLVPRPPLGQRDNEWQSVDWNSHQQPKS